jgi:hypothetical protein
VLVYTSKVEGVPVLLTEYTGASRTVLSTNVFNKIAERKQLELQTSSCLVGTSGLPIQECRKGHFVVRLGTHKRSKEAGVAKIDDDVLSGFDIFEGADILLSRNKIILDIAEIPCFQVRLGDEGKRFEVSDSMRILGNADIVDARADTNEEL